MSTSYRPQPSHGRSFGLASLLTLIVFSAGAEAAPAKKKSDKPSAERAEPKQGASESRAPQGSAPAPATERPGGEMQRPMEAGASPMGAGPMERGASMERGQPMGGVSGQPVQRPSGVSPSADRPSGGVAPSAERQTGGVAPAQGGAQLERGGSDLSRPEGAQVQPKGGVDMRSRTTPDRGGSSASSSPGTGSSASPDRASTAREGSGSDSHARTPPSSSSRGGTSNAAPASHGASRPTNTTRAYASSSNHRSPPSYHSRDHRYGHPSPHHVRTHPHAHRPPPSHAYYRSYYVNYWVHPYYRYRHASTVVVSFGFVVNPWVVTWAPPHRPGWSWSAGYYDAWGYYHPGYWTPVGPAPVYRSVQYVYVPGWWDGNVYVEGFYRPTARSGWTWVDGYYLSDGGYVPGHWQPRSKAPAGYVWQAGFYDGESWVEGFWRPEYRSGYTWVNGYFDEDGIYSAGYWMPTQERPGQVWVPGWFDGHQWVEGYWVSESEYYNADVQGWEPEAGYDDGWQEDQVSSSSPSRSGGDSPRKQTVSASGSSGEIPPASSEEDEVPLAIPVEVQEESVQ